MMKISRFLIWFAFLCGVLWAQSPLLVEVHFDSLEKARREASLRDVWAFYPEAGYFVMPATEVDLVALSEAGFFLEIDEKGSALLAMMQGDFRSIPNFDCYRTVEETFQSAMDLVATYPHLARWEDIGDSWKKIHNVGQGYDLMVLHLSNFQPYEDRPDLFIMSAVHAREYTTAELNTRFAEFLLTQYGQDPTVTWLLDHREIHLLLQANPDGRKIAEGGSSWRKNTNDDQCTSSSFGIDLNRNFPFEWNSTNGAGSSGDPCSDTYRGTLEMSEPEVEAIVDYTRSIFGDYRDDDINSAAPETAEGVFLDVHSFSELILWSWGFTGSAPPNSSGLQSFGRKMAFFNNYESGQSSDLLYFTDGSTKDFAYGEFGIPAYTVELGTSFFQDCPSFDHTIFPDNLQMLLYAAKACDLPYLRAKGPDVATLAALQDGPNHIIVEGLASDSRYHVPSGTEPMQFVAQAEAYLGSEVGVPQVLPLADGNPSSATESFSGRVDISTALQPTLLIVRAVDTEGNEGVPTCLFVQKADPSTKLLGAVYDINTGEGLSATLRSGAHQTRTDPQTGAFELYLQGGSHQIEVEALEYEGLLETISVVSGATTAHSFYLAPVCFAAVEGWESSDHGWQMEGSWSRSDESSFEGDWSLNDSPGGSYGNNLNHSAVSPLYDLSATTTVTIRLAQRYDLEIGYDYGHVEWRRDGGTWQELATVNGNAMTWQTMEWRLDEAAGTDSFQLRFRITSDSSVEKEGWQVDGLEILQDGALCVSPMTYEMVRNLWNDRFTVLDLIRWINQSR